MAERAHVTSVEAIEAFRANLIAYLGKARPLLEDASINGAQGILLNITGSSKLTLHEVHEASSIVQRVAAENANIIFGAVHDEAMEDAVKVTVIATGIKGEKVGLAGRSDGFAGSGRLRS